MSGDRDILLKFYLAMVSLLVIYSSADSPSLKLDRTGQLFWRVFSGT